MVFPELGLTGYLLQDLNAEVAMRADDPRLVELARAADGMSAVVSFVEESDDHRLFISAALLEDGAVRHIHRKVFLPTYGLFDERRFFAAGSVFRAVDSRLGLRLGISVCEDFWHLATPQLLALDGAQVLINVSSSPGRDIAAGSQEGLGTATSWRTLNRTYAQLTTSYVVFVNRVGVDESISFWGGSEVVGPSGATVFQAPLHEEGLFLADDRPARSCVGSASRPRCCATSDRRWSCGSWTGSPDRGPATRRRGWSAPDGRRRTMAGREPPPFELPPELAIDTDSARRIIVGFIRAQLQQAGFERLVLGLSGGIDSALVAYLAAEAVGPANLLCVMMPYRTSSPESQGDAETVAADIGCALDLVDISPMVDAYFGRPENADASAAATRQPHGAHPDDGALRPVGDVARPGHRHRQQDRDAHRLHHAVR